jgi:nucleoid-associated protein YgaU
MSNEQREDLEERFGAPSIDEPSGALDGLDKAMDTEVIEQETLGPVDTGPKTYTVQPGDDLRSIATRFYGTSDDYLRIVEANRGELGDSDTVRPGLTLTIPPKAA